MNILLYVILGFFLLVKAEVVVLSDANITTFMEKNPVLMLEFYAPWCGHCKKFAPEYENAAQKLKEQEKGVVLAKIDCEANTKTRTKYGVSSFPTIKMFINGTETEYGGERTASAVLTYLDKILSPKLAELKTMKEISKVKSARGKRSILISEDPKLIAEYTVVAKKEPYFLFYYVSEELGKKAFPEVEEVPVVVLLKDFEEEDSYFTPQFSKQELQEFLEKNELPLVNMEFNQDILNKIFATKESKKGIMMFRSAYSDDADKIDKEFRKAAEKTQREDYIYVLSDIVQEGYQEKVAFYLTVTPDDLPSLHYVNQTDELIRYVYKGPFEEDKMIKFIKDAEGGLIARYLRSENVSKDNKGPIYKVVGKTFQNDVIKVNKDVLVLFHAPWDEKVVNFSSKFEELAQKMSIHKKLKFASVDLTKNDIPGHPLKEFVMLKLFPAKDKKKFSQYEGELKEEDIVAFLKKKCSYTIEDLE